jgi:phosphotransferase system HPr-like phosphotransfer protein
MNKRWSYMPIIVVTSIILAACSSSHNAPTLLMSQAQQKIEQAQSQGGPEAAPVAFKAAQDHFQQAQAANTSGDYKSATSLLQLAMAEAEYVMAKSEADQAQEAAEQITQALQQLEQEVNK